MKISVFGLGYIGCVSARVVCRQTVTRSSASTSTPTRSRSVNAGRSPVVEPGLDELLGKAVAEGRAARDDRYRGRRPQHATCRCICVGTPSQQNGSLEPRVPRARQRADRRSAARQRPTTTSSSSAARCCLARRTAW